MLENCLRAYIKHKIFSVSYRFIFVDTENGLICNLLKLNNVDYYIVQRMVSKKCKYVIMHVKVAFYHVPKFLWIITQSKETMTNCEYDNYQDFCVNQFRDVINVLTSKSNLTVEEI